MSGSYFKIWVSKMRGDYKRYLTQAVVEMSRTKDELSRTLSGELKMYCKYHSILVPIVSEGESLYIKRIHKHFTVHYLPHNSIRLHKEAKST